MNTETKTRSIFGAGASFEALLAPTYGLADGILYGVSALARKVEKHIAARKRQRAITVTVRELSRLEDRVLKDIGIARHDIHAVSEAIVDNAKIDLRNLYNR